MVRHFFVGVVAVVVAGVVLHAELPSHAADESWSSIEALKKQLAADAPKGVNEVEFSAPIEARLHQEAVAFDANYPADPRHWDARLLEMKTVFFPAPPAERRTIFENQEKLLASVLAADQASPAVKRDAERTVIRQHLDHLDLIESPQEAGALETRLTSYLSRYPDDPKAGALQVRRLDLLQKSDPKKAAELLATLSGSPDPKVVAAIKGRQEQAGLFNQPLDWKFTAVDGTPVDLTQWQGRVVLVDFWASWCPDCLREMPEVIAAYRKYHDQGFEIVGVSLDHDKEALQTFVKKHGMPWPQQYDGKEWDTATAVRYGVRGIPEMWLVDRTGRVVATGLHGSQLDARIAPLLKP